MSDTTNFRHTMTTSGVHAGQAGGGYYHAYYRELVTRPASRAERNRRLEMIKAGRRRARREKWLKGLKSPASVLISSDAAG
jgi:hypothetical protein